MKKKGNVSPFPQKTASNNNTLLNNSNNINEHQIQIEYHNRKMGLIIKEIIRRLYQQNITQNNQNNCFGFISQLSTQVLKELHFFIHQNENSLFSDGEYIEAHQIILIGELIDDELEKRGEIKNPKTRSPSRPKSNLISPIPSKYNSPSPSAPPESSIFSPAHQQNGHLKKKAANKIQKFDDETAEVIQQMQIRHGQLRKEYVSIWEKNMQSHYFKPSKTLQDIRKHVIILRKKCIMREEQLKSRNQISSNIEKQNDQKDSDQDSDEPKFEDFGDEKLKRLITEFKKVYHYCEQLEAEEAEAAQAKYENDFHESQRKIEEKQMMELEIFLKERLLKRQKLLMQEGINVHAILNSPGTKSQLTTRQGSPINSRKNSPSKYKNLSKMPPLISYSKRISRNSTRPETPKNEYSDSDAACNALTKEAISQLTPNIMVNIPSSPALIAIEDKIKRSQEKSNGSIKKSDINKKNNMSPTFRAERRTQTPLINDNDSNIIYDDVDYEMENQPIPFDESKLPPI